ncbi:MAG: PQQ-binding-like beta-propeller repeat protein [Myxococcota bacterium]
MGNGRRSGKSLAVALGCGLPLIAAGAVALWYVGKDPSGPISAVVGVSQNEVVVLRRGFEERGYTHLVSMRDDDVVWTEALFGVQDPPTLASDGERVFVRLFEARGNASVHAFHVETGEFLWRGADPEDVRGEGVALEVRSLFASEAVYQLDRLPGDEARVEVLTLDPATGEERGREVLDGVPDAAFMHDGELHVGVAGAFVRVDRAGEVHALSVAPPMPEAVALLEGERCTPSRVDGTTWSCTERRVVRR